MKKLVFLLFIFCIVFQSQIAAQRFTYEYKYAIDSTRKDSLNTEHMILDIGKSGSKFYSKAKYESDSLIKSRSRKANENGLF